MFDNIGPYIDEEDTLVFDVTELERSHGGYSPEDADRLNETVPFTSEILSEWIKRDFETVDVFLKVFGLQKSDFINTTEENFGSKKIYQREDLFADVLGGFSNVGINLARLFHPYVPQDLCPTRTYKTKEWGDIEISGFRTLQYAEIVRTKPLVKAHMIDITDEKLSELRESVKSNIEIIQKNSIGIADNIKDYRKRLNDRILHLEKRFHQSYPKGYNGVKVDKQAIIQNISSLISLEPWELFAYVPFNTKDSLQGAKDKKLEITDTDKIQKHSTTTRFSVDPRAVVKSLSNMLFLNESEQEENERLQFFDIASVVFENKIPYDVDEGILNGPDILPGKVYRYKRQSLKKNNKELMRELEDSSLSSLESNLRISEKARNKLDSYYGYNKNEEIKSKLDYTISIFRKESEAKRQEEKVLGRLQRLEERSVNHESSGMLFRKFRLGKLEAKLDTIKDLWDLSTRAAVQVKEDRNKISVNDLKKIALNFNISMEDNDILKILKAISNEKPKKVEGDLTIDEIVKLTGLKRQVIVRTFNEIKLGWKNYNQSPETKQKPDVAIKVIEGNVKDKELSIREDQFSIYSKEYLHGLIITNKMEDHLTRNNLAVILDVKPSEISQSFKSINEKREEFKVTRDVTIKPNVIVQRVKTIEDTIISALDLSDLARYVEDYFPEKLEECRNNSAVMIERTLCPKTDLKTLVDNCILE